MRPYNFEPVEKITCGRTDRRGGIFGHLFRVSAGLVIFYIHGLHKLEGWIAYLQHGTPWTLAEEVAGMHMPAPLASAVVATLVQFICSLFIVVGLFTRINAALLAAPSAVRFVKTCLPAAIRNWQFSTHW